MSAATVVLFASASKSQVCTPYLPNRGQDQTCHKRPVENPGLVSRAVFKSPTFFLVKDGPQGQPLRTTNRQPPVVLCLAHVL